MHHWPAQVGTLAYTRKFRIKEIASLTVSHAQDDGFAFTVAGSAESVIITAIVIAKIADNLLLVEFLPILSLPIEFYFM